MNPQSLFLMSTSSSSSSSSSPPPLSSNARRKVLWTRSSASSKARGKRVQHPVDNIDRISNLPDDVLQKILATLPTSDAVKTSVLSKRWVDLWKMRPDLCVDMRHIMRTYPTELVQKVSVRCSKSVTKTINNHRGRLESCTIHHYPAQCEDGTLKRWIQTVTRVKHTKELTLVNYLGDRKPFDGYNMLQFPPETFSHHSLTSLSLTRYRLKETNAFNNCCNLKTLKLFNIVGNARDFSKVFAACSSLEVLVLDIISFDRSGRLKIENKNLEVLLVSCPIMDNIEVYTPRLEILDIRCIFCERANVILDTPKLRFNRNYWVYGRFIPHISYNISSLSQEKKHSWLELLVSQFLDMKRTGCLSARVDMKNPKELEILKEVLLLWRYEMVELELVFKKTDVSREEDECGNNGRVLLDDGKPFPDAYFRVDRIRIYNFDGSNEEEFTFVSRFVTQETVTDKLMIETSSFSPMKKLKTEAAVAKLMKLPNGNEGFTIECF